MSTHPVGRALPALRVAALLLTFACGDPATEPGMRTPSASPSFAQSTQDLRISPATDTVFVGQSRDLTVTTSSGAAISKQAVWTSTDTSIAVVVPTGFSTARVTGRRAGAVTITAASGPKQGTNQTTIALVPVRSVTISPDSVMMQLTDSAQFVATPRDANGNPIGGRVIAWSIGDTTIARVTPTGVVRPRARGTTRVFATVDGIAGSANVRVNVPELSITFTAPKDSANAGDTLTVTYVARNLGDATIPDSVIIRVGLRDALGTVVVATRSGVPRMSAGPTTGVASFSLPYNLAAGTYSIVAFIDCKDILFFSNEAVLASCLSAPSLGGSIPEGNELDNSAQSNFVVRGPDLVGTSITLADSIFTRTQATVTFDFTNSESSTGAGFDVVVGLFDATAGTYPSGTLVSNPALGSRQTRSIAVPVSIPAGLDPAHTYQVVAFADCGGASTNAAARLAACVTNPANAGVIVESSEANNSLRRGVAVATNIARIDATPDSVSFTALGDTLRLTARAYDRSNNPVDGIGFTFTSASPAVVSTTGALLRSIANGSTRIVVSAEGRSDTTRASVFQLVSRVNVFPDSLTLQSVGDTSGFAAHALDRNGNIISGASISWSSLDPAIATVSTGKVTATGVGRARIVATSNLRADTGIVSVTQDVARPTRIVASPDSVILEI